jgi:carotenoid cleavage dioxygenase-like enzyme
MKYKLPRSLMRTRRKEISDLELEVLEGKIPSDISGQAFFMVPAGDCEDEEITKADAAILGGDGMILKLDFCQIDKVLLTFKFSKSESFLIDEATYQKYQIDSSGQKKKNPFHKYHFSDFGLGRMSFIMGMRNRLNTAITPIQFKGEPNPRIVVCTDDGRPYICDPKSLETITPIGELEEWEAMMGAGKKLFGRTFGVQPFPLIMATAHPVFDPKTDEFFGVNYGRAFTDTIKNIGVVNSKIESIKDLVLLILIELPKAIILIFFSIVLSLSNLINSFLTGKNIRRFTQIFTWDGKGKLKKVNLILKNGKNVVIKQTLHQISVTENHVILLDASFKFTPDQIINSLRPFRKADNYLSRFLEKNLRWLMTAPMVPNAKFYFVERKAIAAALSKKSNSQIPDVPATATELPFETLHFLTNYKEENGQITMHLAHNNAACLAEWLRPYDKMYTGKKYNLWQRLTGFGKTPIPDDLLGMIAVGQMDVSRIEKVEIDPTTGNPNRSTNLMSFGNTDHHSKSSESIPNTFNLSFYAYRDQTTVKALPDKIEDIYWMCSGLFPEALTEFIHKMYRNYEHRVISIELFDQITKEGKPSNLIRVNSDSMQIEDSYIFKYTQVGMSPQFIPRKGSQSGSQNGYIICTVYTYVAEQKPGQIECEFWLFDASNLHQGPICRMGHIEAIFGMTLHNAYTETAERPSPMGYLVDIEKELNARLAYKKDAKLNQLFEEQVYPYYKKTRS